MAFESGDLGMPVFLFVAAVANLLFIRRSVNDIKSTNESLSGSTGVALLLTGLAELCWVLPCFVQCLLVYILGSRKAGPETETGCDIQGFYSAFGSVAGMLSSMLLAFFTYRLPGQLPSARNTKLLSICVFLC